jgi:hypothetical protein
MLGGQTYDVSGEVIIGLFDVGTYWRLLADVALVLVDPAGIHWLVL